jgi:alpha-beta hydrolase superfamily lysophospholipase
MKQSIEGRELITLGMFGAAVQGTYHRSRATNTDASERPVGILILNSLSLPRAYTGDAAVYWAESFAESGYPTFRIDLPGLGDSDGSLPADLLDFVNSGGFAGATADKVRELVERFNLSGVIIVGHCAGIIGALFAAEKSPQCQGLVLMDPYFHLKQAVRPKVRQKLSDWALHSSTGRFASNVYDQLRKFYRGLRGAKPPANANFPLLKCWKDVATTGLPILLLKAPARKATGTKPRAGEFDYLQHVLKLAGRRSQVTVKFVDGTDHSFANKAGRSAIRQHTENWLKSCFPMAGQIDRLTNPLRRENSANEMSAATTSHN